MREKLVFWLRNRIKEAGARGIVLGLSGGIDSSLVAALSKEAVGKKRVLGLFLPCHSLRQDLIDAKLVARKLGIKSKKIDLTNIYDNLLKALPKAGGLAAANLKPRLRMLVLYYFANKLNYLVCGTGNKSELMAGYFTKHGDGAADVLPIGGLLKGQVIKLAKDLGLPEAIIAKPPSAGLWLGQTDEEEMGLSYSQLDGILECLDKNKKQVFSKGKVKKVKEMIKRSEHKREAPGICRV